MTKLVQICILLTVALAGGCGGDDKKSPQTTDLCGSDMDPWKGTCVEAFFAEESCFDPAGECSGTRTIDSTTGNYESDLSWNNGARLRLSTGGATATSELLSSLGAVCATGTTAVTTDVTNPLDVKQVSTTTWTRASDDKTLKLNYEYTYDNIATPDRIYVTVACPDDSTFRVNLASYQNASSCIAGENANRCTIKSMDEDAGQDDDGGV